jgi:hypothetical protein
MMTAFLYHPRGAFHVPLAREYGLVKAVIISYIDERASFAPPQFRMQKDGRNWAGISLGLFSQYCGVSMSTTQRALREMVLGNIVFVHNDGNGSVNFYSVNQQVVNEVLLQDLLAQRDEAANQGNSVKIQQINSILRVANRPTPSQNDHPPSQNDQDHIVVIKEGITTTTDPSQNDHPPSQNDQGVDPKETAKGLKELLLFGDPGYVLEMESGVASLFDAILEVCKIPPRIIAKSKEKAERIIDIYADGLTGEQVRELYGGGGWWYTQFWKGQKGDKPTLNFIEQTYLTAMDWRPDQSDNVAEQAWLRFTDFSLNMKDIFGNYETEGQQRMRWAAKALGSRSAAGRMSPASLQMNKGKFIKAYQEWTNAQWWDPVTGEVNERNN